MRLRRMRPSPGAVIGTIALVFAFTGAAVAANKVQTNEIANKAVTNKKLASGAVKGGKIRDGSVKEDKLAEGVVPEQAFGRVNKAGASVTVQQGAEGIVGAASIGTGVICYDLAFAPASGSATPVLQNVAAPGPTAELVIGAAAGCAAPFTDAQTVTKRSTNGAPEDASLYLQFIG